MLNGEAIVKKNYIVIEKEFSGTETILLEFSEQPHLIKRAHNLRVLQYGSLIYALPIKTRKVMHEYEREGAQISIL